QRCGGAGAGRVIVEGVVKFDFEITLLTVSAVDGVHFCAPVGHRQQDGDYRESWQPQQMSELALKRAQEIARHVVLALGGHGLFGVELFVCGDDVIFREVSPRLHHNGILKSISQPPSQFALHLRAFFGTPVAAFLLYGSASPAVTLPPLSGQSATVEEV
ncbi:ATP-grasp domain-containing protein, partial [Leptospira borgpetersenii serovar Hardjo-bovis]|nr:ATP-grasp domain-containing protein [Leptospira borgpetersenii serovar Hardjo-bovis]